jgi:tartrate dehydratase beta subunit/fumarate hydratase class I family protein
VKGGLWSTQELSAGGVAGTLVVARDIAHAKLLERIESGQGEATSPCTCPESAYSKPR